MLTLPLFLSQNLKTFNSLTMKDLFKNPYFVAIVVVVLLYFLLKRSRKAREFVGEIPENVLPAVISARLKSIEALPEGTDWRESIQQRADSEGITYREQALRDIAFLIQNTSFRADGKRLYTDQQIRDAIFAQYKVNVLPEFVTS